MASKFVAHSSGCFSIIHWYSGQFAFPRSNFVASTPRVGMSIAVEVHASSYQSMSSFGRPSIRSWSECQITHAGMCMSTHYRTLLMQNCAGPAVKLSCCHGFRQPLHFAASAGTDVFCRLESEWARLTLSVQVEGVISVRRQECSSTSNSAFAGIGENLGFQT